MMLETERLVLRELNSRDVDSVYKIYKRADKYFRYTRIPYPYKRKDAEEFIRRILASYKKKDKYYMCIIEKKSAQLAGSVALNQINVKDNNGDIGYSIDKRFAKNGYATEAAGAFIDYVFKRFRLHRLSIGCAVKNTASRKVIKKLGAKDEGVLREYVRSGSGRYFDICMYSILRKEWKKKVPYRLKR